MYRPHELLGERVHGRFGAEFPIRFDLLDTICLLYTSFVSTNIKAEDNKPIMTGNGTMFQAITGEIMRNIPVGYNSYKKRQESEVLRCV